MENRDRSEQEFFLQAFQFFGWFHFPGVELSCTDSAFVGQSFMNLKISLASDGLITGGIIIFTQFLITRFLLWGSPYIFWFGILLTILCKIRELLATVLHFQQMITKINSQKTYN
jgi:hypothetical protein